MPFFVWSVLCCVVIIILIVVGYRYQTDNNSVPTCPPAIVISNNVPNVIRQKTKKTNRDPIVISKTDHHSTQQSVNTFLDKIQSNINSSFDSISHPTPNQYDLRIFTDEGGNVFYPWVFSKTLVHDDIHGFPTKESVDSMLIALYEGTEEALYNIMPHPDSNRKLENIYSSQSFTLFSDDASTYSLPLLRPIEAEGSVCEMMEVYVHVLKRDIPFNILESIGAEDVLVNALNSFSDRTTLPLINGAITGQSLFRGSSPGELYGPYISQLLYHDYNMGSLVVKQQYATESDVVFQNGITPSEYWLYGQNGQVRASNQNIGFKYIYNSRVLASVVHRDPLYQLYQSSTLVCFKLGIDPVGYTNPNNSDWTSGGKPFVLSMIATVSLEALKAAWHYKYYHALRVRPEVYAHRIHLAYTNEEYINKVPGLRNIKNIIDTHALPIIDEVRARSTGYDNYHLGVLYPEQSPTHPSYVAGHAVVAGACVTVMKALLRTHDSNGHHLLWPKEVVHSTDGDSIDAYTGSIDGMTITGELNKLASNIAIGRDMAGVHYRCDGDCGLRLGQQVAHKLLENSRYSIHESNKGFLEPWRYETFDGSYAIIN